jgi:signal peptidase
MPADSAAVQAIKLAIERQGWIELPSNGCSMFPLIRQGSVCRFSRDLEPVRVGDVLLFVSLAGALVGHRLHRIERDGAAVRYVCRGDSNLTFDAPVTAERIVGKLTDIRTANARIRADDRRFRIWRRIMLHAPVVTRIVHHYLGWRRKRNYETSGNA